MIHSAAAHSRLTSSLDVQIAQMAQVAARAADKPMVLAGASLPRRPFASGRGLVVSWTLFLALTIVNLETGGIFGPKPTPLEPGRLVAALEVSAALNGRLVEAYRSAHGSLPWALSDVGLAEDDPTLEYQRNGEGSFRIIARHGDHEGLFNSEIEAERRAAIARARSAAASAYALAQEELAAETERWFVELQRSSQRTHETNREWNP